MPARTKPTALDVLQAEEDRQRVLVTGRAIAAHRTGRPLSRSDIYPDVEFADSMGYTRQGVPLLPMSLLYEKLVVYVPPASKKELRRRWGISIEELGELAARGIVEPLIGHITDYSAPHFASLFESPVGVPSVWTRGLTLLEEKGLQDTLLEESYSFDFDQLASENLLGDKFRLHFPGMRKEALHRRIKRELLTNLADLYLFDEPEVVESLQVSALKTDPSEVARAIMLLSELRAYPTLFGLGGTANYSADLVPELPNLGANLDWALTTPTGRGVKLGQFSDILKGVGVSPEELTLEQVVDFHSSGQARLLRKSVAAFEREAGLAASSAASELGSVERLLAEAEALNEVVRDSLVELGTPAQRRRYGSLKRRTTWAFEMGGLAVGGWVGQQVVGEAWGAVGGAALVRTSLEYFKGGVAEAISSTRFRPGVANLWRIRDAAKK